MCSGLHPLTQGRSGQDQGHAVYLTENEEARRVLIPLASLHPAILHGLRGAIKRHSARRLLPINRLQYKQLIKPPWRPEGGVRPRLGGLCHCGALGPAHRWPSLGHEW